MSTKVLTFLILSLTAAVVAEDFKTINGKEYKDAIVTRVEPDGIVVKTRSGISKLYFTELPKEVQQRFNYDPEKAAAYSAEQSAASEQIRKQQEQEMRQQADKAAKQKAVSEWYQGDVQTILALQERYVALQQDEGVLSARIAELDRLPKHVYTKRSRYANPARADLPALKKQLGEVRRQKSEVKEELTWHNVKVP